MNFDFDRISLFYCNISIHNEELKNEKGLSEKNSILQLDTGTVQELFQKDLRKVPSDSENDFEKRILQEKGTLHSTQSFISLATESFYDSEIYKNVSALLKAEGNFLADEFGRENKTKFGLETILEEMHDQSEDVIDSETRVERPNSGLFYEEYEIDLRGQTSEELHRSEEFQRLLSLLMKPKDVVEGARALSDINVGDSVPNVMIETTTNRKVECTLKEVKNTKFYLKGDGRPESGIKLVEGIPSEGDYKSYEMRRVEEPPEHPKIEQPHGSHQKCPSHEIAPSEVLARQRKCCGRSQSAKPDKRHGSCKRSSKSRDKKRQTWAINFTSVSNAVPNQVKDYLTYLLPRQNEGVNGHLRCILRRRMPNSLNLRNALATVGGLVSLLILVGVVFYKPPGIVDYLMGRLGRRRTPFQSFYDTLLTILHGISP